jgi:hypothetical protein
MKKVIGIFLICWVAMQVQARLPIERLQREMQIRYTHTSQTLTDRGHVIFLSDIPRNDAHRFAWEKTPCSNIPPAYPPDNFYGEELLPEECIFLVSDLMKKLNESALWSYYVTTNQSYETTAVERPAFLDLSCNENNYASIFGDMMSFVQSLNTIRSWPKIQLEGGIKWLLSTQWSKNTSSEDWMVWRDYLERDYNELLDRAYDGYHTGYSPFQSDKYHSFPPISGFIWDYRIWDERDEWIKYLDYHSITNFSCSTFNCTNEHSHFSQMVYMKGVSFVQPHFYDVNIRKADIMTQIELINPAVACLPSGYTMSDINHVFHFDTLSGGEKSAELKSNRSDLPAFPDDPEDIQTGKLWGWFVNKERTYSVIVMDYKPRVDYVSHCVSCLDGVGTVQGSLASIQYTIGLGKIENGDTAGVLELHSKELDFGIAELSRLKLHAESNMVTSVYSNDVLHSITAPQTKIIFTELPKPASGFIADIYTRIDSSTPFETNTTKQIVVAQGMGDKNVAEAWASGDFSSIPHHFLTAVYAYEIKNSSCYKQTRIGAEEALRSPTINSPERSNYKSYLKKNTRNNHGEIEEDYEHKVDGLTNSIIRTKSDWIYGKSEHSVEIYFDFEWGRDLIRSEKGSEYDDNSLIWSDYAYYTNQTDHGYGQMKSVQNSDGSWERYEYNASGELVKTISPFGDQTIDAPESQCRVYQTSTSKTGDVFTTTYIERIMATEVSRSYTIRSPYEIRSIECVTVGAAIDAADNRITITTYEEVPDDDNPFTGKRIAKVEHWDGMLTLKSYPTDETEITWRGVPNGAATAVIEGTRTEIEKNCFGYVIDRKVYDIASGVLTDSEVAIDFDDTGKPKQWNYLDGTTRSQNPGCCGVDSEVDKEGSTRIYEYGPGGQPVQTTFYTAEGESVTEISSYDGAGRLRRQGYLDGSTKIWHTEYRYDTAGRMTSSVNAADGETTYQYTFSDIDWHELKITTYPGGGTETNEYFYDGRLFKRTGTAVPNIQMEYSIEDGEQVTKTIYLGDSGETTQWSKEYVNFAGQSYKTVYSDGSFEQSWFNSKGQVWKTVDRDGVASLFSYNGKGEQEVSAMDFDRDDTIDYAGMDRITKTTREIVAAHGTDVVRTTTEIWDQDHIDAPRTVAIQEVSVDGLQTWSTQDGLTTHTLTAYVPAEMKRITTTTHFDDTQQIVTTINGQVSSQEWKDATGSTIRILLYQYDEFGRLFESDDSMLGITQYEYYQKGLLKAKKQINRNNPSDIIQESYGYDAFMRVTITTNADFSVTYTGYHHNGQIQTQYGASVYPVEYGYDVQGRKTTMTTWQNEDTGDGEAVTTWIYNPTNGTLARKEYNDGKGTDYTYTPGGRLETRSWERGITTTYGYDDLGQVETTEYTDGTEPVSYTYDRLGRIKTADNGNAAYTYGYSNSVLKTESVNDRGRNNALSCVAPPSEPYVRFSRIRLSS